MHVVTKKLHYYVKVHKRDKRKKLCDLLDRLEFRQVVIFVKSETCCTSLRYFLMTQSFPAVELHRKMGTHDRLDSI